MDSEPEFFFPEMWRKKADNVKQGSSEEGVSNSTYFVYQAETATCHALSMYQEMLDGGVCAEQARMVLPQNTMTEWVWSGTLGAWADMCRLRLD